MRVGNDAGSMEAVIRAQKALQCLVVPVPNGATTGCVTIRPLLKLASPVTAGWEALRTMFPHYGGIGFV